MLRLNADFESHLQGEVTTHCFAWILRRKDGHVLGFCDHDKMLIVQGENCFPQSGMNGSEAGSQLGLALDSAEIEGALTGDMLRDEDIECGLYDGAVVETYLVNWAQPEQAVMLRSAVIGKISRSGMRFVAELKSVSAMLERVFGRRAKRGCDAEFADARCGMNPADPRFYAEAVVEHVSGPDMIVAGLAGFEAHWFERGTLKWLSGKNQGSTNAIVSHFRQANEASLILQELPVYDVQTGDRFRVLAGCDKSFQQCRDRFGNHENFRGFPHIPGNDAAYSYADGQSNFDGGALVP